MKMTLEQQVELETMIKDRGKWVGFRNMIAFIYKLYRAGTLSEAQYLEQHARYTIQYAGGKNEHRNNKNND